MKSTTRRGAAQVESAGPTFADLLSGSGKSPAQVEVETGASAATISRSGRGQMPRRPYVIAFAVCFGTTEDAVRAAIERSARLAGRGAA